MVPFSLLRLLLFVCGTDLWALIVQLSLYLCPLPSNFMVPSCYVGAYLHSSLPFDFEFDCVTLFDQQNEIKTIVWFFKPELQENCALPWTLLLLSPGRSRPRPASSEISGCIWKTGGVKPNCLSWAPPRLDVSREWPDVRLRPVEIRSLVQQSSAHSWEHDFLFKPLRFVVVLHDAFFPIKWCSLSISNASLWLAHMWRSMSLFYFFLSLYI